MIRSCPYCRTALSPADEVMMCKNCRTSFPLIPRIRIEVFGISNTPVEGRGVRSSKFGEIYVVSVEKFQTVRSFQTFVAALRKLYTNPQISWVCIQSKLSTIPDPLIPSSSAEVPSQLVTGLDVLATYSVNNVFILVDSRNVFRVCVKKPQSLKSARYSMLYAIATSLVG